MSRIWRSSGQKFKFKGGGCLHRNFSHCVENTDTVNESCQVDNRVLIIHACCTYIWASSPGSFLFVHSRKAAAAARFLSRGYPANTQLNRAAYITSTLLKCRCLSKWLKFTVYWAPWSKVKPRSGNVTYKRGVTFTVQCVWQFRPLSAADAPNFTHLMLIMCLFTIKQWSVAYIFELKSILCIFLACSRSRYWHLDAWISPLSLLLTYFWFSSDCALECVCVFMRA